MKYRENSLSYEDYHRLRESVNWKNFSKIQAENALKHSLYTVTAVEHDTTIAMGRLIGDSQYYLIADVIVHPEFQGQKIGTAILHQLLQYVEKHTPTGGRSSVQLISENGKEPFYEAFGFKKIPHAFCGSGMRKVVYNESEPF